MGGLLSELGKRLAERWVTLLVLPGALYLVVAAAGHTLGHARPFDMTRLTGQLTTTAKEPVAQTVGGQAIILAAVLAGAAAAGLLVQAIGSTVERVLLAANWYAWPGPFKHLARRRITRRQRRWETATAHLETRLGQDARVRALGGRADPAARWMARHRRDRIAVEYPERPTWAGDRIHAVALRLNRDHCLDLAVVWPALWLVLPDSTRSEITTSRRETGRAASLIAWGLLYLPVTVWWWPAGLISISLFAMGQVRFRSTIDDYALLLEAAVRVHCGTLLQYLGLHPAQSPAAADAQAPPSPLNPDAGEALMRLLRSESPPGASGR
ncbi:hypothetical protein [Streptomyces sp. NPDC015345]|uniref:hypothetical protein n=1 Tax=Streptomyces sp. NPDC015345 TaxID=3364953 RepID=UPI0037006334